MTFESYNLELTNFIFYCNFTEVSLGVNYRCADLLESTIVKQLV